MFSYEIEEKLKNNDFLLYSKDYIRICNTSPQISRVKYSPYDDFFEIWTKDDCYWRFRVIPQKSV